MAVAVVSHAALRGRALKLGFPLYTKVKCESGLNGYQIWDKWIRENVYWVIETAFDPVEHVKITESAQLVGELKDPWELRCQKFLEGDETYNTFRSFHAEGEDFQTHVNRQAIQVAVSNAMFKYKVDFETDESGTVITHNALTVAIFDAAEDTSISYTSDIEVAQLWTTKVEHVSLTTESISSWPVLFKRAYADDPVIEESYPWIKVGVLTMAEWEDWKEHNIKPEVTLDDISLDVRAIDDNIQVIDRSVEINLSEKASLAYDNPLTALRKESIHLPAEGRGFADLLDEPESFASVSTPANIATILQSASRGESQESTYRTVTVSYPEADNSSVSGDVSD